MVLQNQRLLYGVGFLHRNWKVGLAFNFEIILHHDVVVEDGYGSGLGHSSIAVKPRGVEDDVVRLPFAWFAGGIDERG